MPVFLQVISPLAKGENSAERLTRKIRKLTDLIQFRLPQKDNETLGGDKYLDNPLIFWATFCIFVHYIHLFTFRVHI